MFVNQCTVQTFTESEDTRCCVNTIFPPEDGVRSQPVYCAAVYRERRYQMLCEYNFSS